MTANKKLEDQDLEEILNEIETLQEDLRETSAKAESRPTLKAVAPVAADLESEPSTEMPASASAPVAVNPMSGSALLDAAIEQDETEDASLSEPSKATVTQAFSSEDTSESVDSDGSLTLSLKGSMTLKLNYECAGQTVSVSFGGDFLRVQLADGTEFKIPMAKRSLKAA